jgi:hypothetical protein
MNPNAPGNQSAIPKPTAPKPAASTAAAKQKEADKKMLAQAQALLAKQRATLAAIEKSQASITDTTAGGAANDYLNLGPTGGLAAGTIAGVNAPLPKEQTPTDGAPTGGTPTGGTWTKAGTVQTANGLVDVDANGIAQDGSTPVAATQTTTTGAVPTLVDTITDDYGNKIGVYSDGSKKTLVSSGRKYRLTVDEDAYSILTKTLEDYNIGDLAKIIQGYMDRGLGSEQAALEIRKEPLYLERFAGNETRRKAGLNVLSEAEYLELENSYMKTLKAFGVPNELGKDKATRQTAMANLIAGDVDAIEFKDRVDTVVSRVKNADKTMKSTFNTFFGIKDEDLISYFLNPEANLPKLQEKVTAAEIGAAAKGQNLATSLDAATALAQFGVTREQARTGYEAIGEVLPTATKLGEIYGDQYTQTTAEQEVFQGTASAKRKRQQLAEREVASFSGSSGRMRTGRPQGNTGQF